MTAWTCVEPLAIEDLIDYSAGDLPEAQQHALEEHLFACEGCAGRLEPIMQLGAAVAEGVREGRVTATVSTALLAQAAASGARVREYRLQPGETVACTAGPDDSFVAIRLAGFDGVAELALDVEFHDLASGERRTRHVDGVPVDALAREVVLLFPGDVVRAYPRSRWTLHAHALRHGEAWHTGPYTLDHTPWDQLPGPPQA